MRIFNWTLVIVHALVVVAAAGHALLFKRDPRAALGWIAVCLLFPFVGPLLYFLFGINRVRTRARKLDRLSPFRIEEGGEPGYDRVGTPEESLLLMPECAELVQVSETVTRSPLLGGNRVETLHNGEQAYPSMLKAIETAESSLFLSTYIFGTGRTGRGFIDALGRSARRGVDVRVLIDGIGELNAFPRAGTLLKREGVRVARFLPPRLIPPFLHINLRNHRKILVADGAVAFVGGMNIGDHHLAENMENPSRVVDFHFRVTGPVVHQIERIFLEDWRFCTGEHTVKPPLNGVKGGSAFCRTIAEGPNEDWDKLAAILMGAVSAARKRVTVMTPYFLPSRELIGGMVAAALRGVEVRVILPGKNNLPLVHWASRNMLWEFLQRGIRVYYQPPPFVHAKLFMVDDHYVQIGSANIDPRSLRLNFELAVEVFDRAFAASLGSFVDASIDKAREVSLAEVDSRPFPIRVRDALAWLFTPYL